MVEFKGIVKTDRVRKLLERTPRIVFEEMERAFRDDGTEWLRAMQNRFRGGSPLFTRTGTLRRSLTTKTSGTGLGSLKVRNVSAGVIYATIQEFGGVVTPRRAKDLWIPIGENKTPAGVARTTPRVAFSLYGTGPGRLFIFRSKRGNKIAARTIGSRLIPMFVLKQSVRIPPRLGFFSTWDGFADSRMQRHRDAIARALRRARRGAGG